MSFLDLPIEILPEIVSHIAKPQHFVTLCLVNKSFYTFASEKLYEKIYIYSWHRESKVKVVQLFTTLSRYSHLSRYVKRLEIRDFPKAITTDDNDVLSNVISGLRNCINLTSCTWTRDGVLSTEILEALHSCQQLRALEINGHSEGHYDPRSILGFKGLQHISIIMPSLALVSQLKLWINTNGESLRNLTLICKASGVITDSLLESIAPYLPNLRYFSLTGCPKVTRMGVLAIASSSRDRLLGLSLEGVSPQFDVDAFATSCISGDLLSRLQSLTLTVKPTLKGPALKGPDWTQAVTHLVSTSPLERFQIYSTGSTLEASSTDELWANLVQTHGQRLRRISIHRMLISLESIENICAGCPNLEELFLVMDAKSVPTLAKPLSQVKKLRTVHINSPLEPVSDTDAVSTSYGVLSAHALSVIQEASSSLSLFGWNTKVWQVDRKIIKDVNGTLRTERILAPYSSPEIPEQFTVVRI